MVDFSVSLGGRLYDVWQGRWMREENLVLLRFVLMPADEVDVDVNGLACSALLSESTRGVPSYQSLIPSYYYCSNLALVPAHPTVPAYERSISSRYAEQPQQTKTRVDLESSLRNKQDSSCSVAVMLGNFCDGVIFTCNAVFLQMNEDQGCKILCKGCRLNDESTTGRRWSTASKARPLLILPSYKLRRSSRYREYHTSSRNALLKAEAQFTRYWSMLAKVFVSSAGFLPVVLTTVA